MSSDSGGNDAATAADCNDVDDHDGGNWRTLIGRQ